MINVCAPLVETLHIEVLGVRISLQKNRDGRWQCQVHLLHGDDHEFVIDGRSGVTDARSCWQPKGAHGPSRSFDHAIFNWTDRHLQAPSPMSFPLERTQRRLPSMQSWVSIDDLIYLVAAHIELVPDAWF
jgi:1,4-alpha-glucan branching enzyme